MKTIETTAVIVGAGLTGIGLSYYLSKQGIAHRLLEKSDRVGGIWSSLDWPGLRCDTEILNYSYRFNPLLSRQSMVSGEEISNYLETTADKFDISPKICFQTRVLSARFSTRQKRWHIDTTRGQFRARFLLNANGYFADEPHIPRFPGSSDFAGEIRHLFTLDRDTELGEKSVVLVGSGASAISAAPALAARCRSLTLLQRSPSYIYEDSNRVGRASAMAQTLYRAGIHFPVKIVNWFQQLKSDLVFVVFRAAPSLGRWFFRRHWRDTVDRDTWAEHFRPRYNPWEQRIPVAVGLKRLLHEARISLVTGRIKNFDRDGIVLEDGRRIDTEVCILATGFDLRFFAFDILIDRRKVDTRGINFYRGMMMGGLPNYFQPFGPAHTSFTGRIETIGRLVARIILHMRENSLDMVSIDRVAVAKRPRITPNYVMRNLPDLPAFYGSLELPSIDNWLYYRFRPGDYRFCGAPPGYLLNSDEAYTRFRRRDRNGGTKDEDPQLQL
jgi:cation diffusion facilitator CzcD-associated flavoprotein CzcO